MKRGLTLPPQRIPFVNGHGGELAGRYIILPSRDGIARPTRRFLERGKATQLNLSRAGVVDVNGNVVIDFPPPPPLVQFSARLALTVVNPVYWNVYLDRILVDILNGNNGSTYTQLPGQQLQLTASGLTPGTVYTASFLGKIQEAGEEPVIPSLIAPISVIGTELVNMPLGGGAVWNAGGVVACSAISVIPTNGIIVRGLSTNQGIVWVGNSAITFGVGGGGTEVQAGQDTPFTCDLKQIYFIANTPGDGVSWNVT